MDSKKRGYVSLGTLETSVYTATWIFGVGYSLYHVLRASSRYYYKLVVTELESGWLGSKYKMDGSDSEWMVFSELLIFSLPWFLIHLFGTQTFKKRKQIKSLLLFTLLLSLIFLAKCLGVNGTLFVLMQPLVFFIATCFTRKTVVFWGLGIWFLSGFQWFWPTSEVNAYLSETMSGVSFYVMMVTMCWINARCLSYSLDVSWGRVPKRDSIVEELLVFLAYCFYFPICIGGPIVLYETFYDGIHSDYISWTSIRARETVLLILRYIFWMGFSYFVIHFFYFSAIQFKFSIMEQLDLWTLCGVGYAMGQFFHLKYVVFYGFPRPFVMADGIEIPYHPLCIGRIHLYSDMWRNFDYGLYLFLHKYIYKALLKDEKRLLFRLAASAVSFSFVFVWHSVMEQIFVWSLLNFIGISIEGFARHLSKTESYQNFEKKYLTPRWERRLHAALGSPLFLFSIISNFYFFMGKSVGDLYLYRTLTSWPVGTLTILVFMYSGAQTSIEAKNWELHKQCLNAKKR